MCACIHACMHVRVLLCKIGSDSSVQACACVHVGAPAHAGIACLPFSPRVASLPKACRIPCLPACSCLCCVRSAAERARLQERGHSVRHRLFGLNISRMLGDRFLKDEDLGFIAEPHISDIQVCHYVGDAMCHYGGDAMCHYSGNAMCHHGDATCRYGGDAMCHYGRVWCVEERDRDGRVACVRSCRRSGGGAVLRRRGAPACTLRSCSERWGGMCAPALLCGRGRGGARVMSVLLR